MFQLCDLAYRLRRWRRQSRPLRGCRGRRARMGHPGGTRWWLRRRWQWAGGCLWCLWWWVCDVCAAMWSIPWVPCLFDPGTCMLMVRNGLRDRRRASGRSCVPSVLLCVTIDHRLSVATRCTRACSCRRCTSFLLAVAAMAIRRQLTGYNTGKNMINAHDNITGQQQQMQPPPSPLPGHPPPPAPAQWLPRPPPGSSAAPPHQTP